MTFALQSGNHRSVTLALFLNGSTFAYYYFGKALKGLQTSVDIGIGAAATVLVIAFVIYLRRKEASLTERADREVPDEALDGLDRAA